MLLLSTCLIQNWIPEEILTKQTVYYKKINKKKIRKIRGASSSTCHQVPLPLAEILLVLSLRGWLKQPEPSQL